eukprot:5642208-Alexandrium_andersonii.AAC.1
MEQPWGPASSWEDPARAAAGKAKAAHEAGGLALFDYIVKLKQGGTLSAKMACTLAHLATAAGAQGE